MSIRASASGAAARPRAPGLLALLSSSVLLWCPGPAQESVEPPSALTRAEAFLAEGRFAEARAIAQSSLRRAAGADAEHRWRWFLAESFTAEKDHETATRLWSALAQSARAPFSFEAAMQEARSRLEMWDTEGARAALEALPAEAPPQLHATRDELLASACFVDGDKRAAGARFERLALKGQAASYNLGLIAFEAGRYEEALALFERASQNADPHYYTLLYRAWCLLELNRFDEGRNVLEEIIRMAGTPESYQLLGRLELRAGGHARAEAAFRKATTLAPALAEARFGLATALRHLGRSEESRETFARFRALHEAEQAALRRAYELNQDQLARPEDPRAALRLAELYLETGDATGAERVAWTALRLEPEGVEARLCLARALSRQARFREALLHYRRILTEHSAHALARAAETELRAMIDRHGRAR